MDKGFMSTIFAKCFVYSKPLNAFVNGERGIGVAHASPRYSRLPPRERGDKTFYNIACLFPSSRQKMAIEPSVFINAQKSDDTPFSASKP